VTAGRLNAHTAAFFGKTQGYEVDEEVSVSSSSVIRGKHLLWDFSVVPCGNHRASEWGAYVPGLAELFLSERMAIAVADILLS
jgi:hypothetical protein